MEMLVDAPLDDGGRLECLAVAAKPLAAVIGHIVILSDLGEALRKEETPTLFVWKRIRPLEREALAKAGLVQLVSVAVVGMVPIPCATVNRPVVALVLRAEAGIDNPG